MQDKNYGMSVRCVHNEGHAAQISVTTSDASNIEKTSATLNGIISNPSNISITQQGFELKLTSGGSYTQVTLNVGDPLSYNITTGLTPNTSYTFRAFAKTTQGFIYGSEVSFTTTGIVVTTAAATNIDLTSAKLNGIIVNTSSDVINPQGFEWKAASDGNYTNQVDQVDVSGSMMSYNLTGLSPLTTYTFRAFATTTDSTIYGSEVNFTTPNVNLSTLTDHYEAQDHDILSGTLNGPYKITIADGATVTLQDVTINGTNNANYDWAGINCLNSATIILEGTNTVKGFYEDYPGVYIAPNKTLNIQGTGTLNASSNGWGAGIGGGYDIPCGNIVIENGNIIANGGNYAAGIGSGSSSNVQNRCGDITINGGTVTAIGGEGQTTDGDYNGAGIGTGRADNQSNTCGNITINGGTVMAQGAHSSAGIGNGYSRNSNVCGNISITGGTVTAKGGYDATGIGNGRTASGYGYCSCGDITIESTVTKVTAIKGGPATRSIGQYSHFNVGTCGTVTIGGTDYSPGVSPSSGNTYTYSPQP